MTGASNLRINADRLVSRLKELGRVGALPGGGVCRLALTQEDQQGRDLVVSWMRALGLEVIVDDIGNIFGRRAGRQNIEPVMIGSHIDTVATGGLYDGCLGVLAGLEVVESLNEAGLTTDRPIVVAAFTNEEGARFAPDMMGSLVYVGGLAVEEARATQGIDGQTVGDCLERIGYGGTRLEGAPAVHAYLELHIEQGPVLEDEDLQIGVVEGVQGISWQEFTVRGRSSHAGTTPMRLRRDAGLAAAQIAAAVHAIVTEIGGAQVGTVGSFNLHPNLVNVVPETARFTVDLRNTDEQLLQQAERRLAERVVEIAARVGVSVEVRALARFEPVEFDKHLVAAVEAGANRLGMSNRRMPSGAGHDAQMLARICPAAMIFVPSVDGISHNIQELTHPADLENGANLLLATVLETARSGANQEKQ